MRVKISDFFIAVSEFIYIRFFRNPIQWTIQVFDLVDFVANILNNIFQILFGGRPFYWGLMYNPLVSPNRRLVVLANGPSLNEDLERLTKEDMSNIDFAMMNFSANSPLFQKYKPKYYCLADPAFFTGGCDKESVRNIYKTLNDLVDWDLTLIVSYNVKHVKKYSNITNPHIEFQRVFSMRHNGHMNLMHWFYKMGLAIPGLGTVTNMAAYAGIQYGYKQIEFCGNDMSLLDGLCVNDDNYTCVELKHFYDDNVELKPMMISDTQYHTLYSYVLMISAMVLSHNNIAEYGKYMGVGFINRTRKSMLDCYPRLIKIHPEEFEN